MIHTGPRDLALPPGRRSEPRDQVPSGRVIVCTNPSSGTTFRLLEAGGSWQITRHREPNGRVHWAHFGAPARGAQVGWVAAWIAGFPGSIRPGEDHRRVYAAIVLADFERSADMLLATAKEVERRTAEGRRDSGTQQRQQRRRRDQMLALVTAELRAMGQAWLASGLDAGRTNPRWLALARDDGAAAPT